MSSATSMIDVDDPWHVIDCASLEEHAIRWRAETGVIPWEIYAALAPEERSRVGVMSQTAARRVLAAGTAPSLPHHAIDDLAIESLTTHVRKPR